MQDVQPVQEMQPLTLRSDLQGLDELVLLVAGEHVVVDQHLEHQRTPDLFGSYNGALAVYTATGFSV